MTTRHFRTTIPHWSASSPVLRDVNLKKSNLIFSQYFHIVQWIYEQHWIGYLYIVQYIPNRRPMSNPIIRIPFIYGLPSSAKTIGRPRRLDDRLGYSDAVSLIAQQRTIIQKILPKPRPRKKKSHNDKYNFHSSKHEPGKRTSSWRFVDK